MKTPIPYTTFEPLWPPRPEIKVPRTTFNFYQGRGYWGQIKKNGTYTVIYARGKEVIFLTRHRDQHKAWTPLPEHVAFFQSNSTEWTVFCAELLHSKTPHIKNQLYVFDIIVDGGQQLTGVSFAERQKLLYAKFPHGEYEVDQYRVHPYVSLAINFKSNFGDLWAKLKPEDEGLVFKNPAAPLVACNSEKSNAAWQVKSRRPTRNYSF